MTRDTLDVDCGSERDVPQPSQQEFEQAVRLFSEVVHDRNRRVLRISPSARISRSVDRGRDFGRSVAIKTEHAGPLIERSHAQSPSGFRLIFGRYCRLIAKIGLPDLLWGQL